MDVEQRENALEGSSHAVGFVATIERRVVAELLPLGQGRAVRRCLWPVSLWLNGAS